MKGTCICPKCDNDILFDFELNENENEETCQECGTKVKWTLKQPVEARCMEI